jgi:hypothetical protein
MTYKINGYPVTEMYYLEYKRVNGYA